MIILLDNTVLSNFSSIGRPDLVRLALGETAATVTEAFAEYATGVQAGKIPGCDWSWLPILNLDEAQRPHYEQLHVRLGSGEAACIALAFAHKYRVCTDDRDARKIAAQMQVPVTGTLGLLVRLVEQGHLSDPEADAWLGRMIAAGYRAPVASLTELR